MKDQELDLLFPEIFFHFSFSFSESATSLAYSKSVALSFIAIFK